MNTENICDSSFIVILIVSLLRNIKKEVCTKSSYHYVGHLVDKIVKNLGIINVYPFFSSKQPG